MIVPLTHPSSTEFWLQGLHDNLYCSNDHINLCNLPSDYELKICSADAKDISEVLFLSLPIFVTCFNHNNLHRRKSCVRPTRCIAHIPENSYILLKKSGYDFYIPRPELCFLQAAKDMDLIDLILLGYDLCSLYTQNKYERFNITPITSVELLTDFINTAKGFKGITKARQALKYIRNNSNSPMETKIAVMASLPKPMGGYHLPTFEMNGEVNLCHEGTLICGYNHLHADLLWRTQKVALEYNSTAYHMNPQILANDMNRQAALNLTGYTHIAFTQDDLSSFTHFEHKMNALKKALRSTGSDEYLMQFTYERNELFRRLFKQKEEAFASSYEQSILQPGFDVFSS